MSDWYLMKFWRKDCKCFVGFDYEGLYINYDNGQIYTRSGSLNVTDRYIRLQCTGRRDINGELIYDGDIVKFPSGQLTAIKKGEDAITVHVDNNGIEYKKAPDEIGVVHNMGNAFYVGAKNLKIKKYYGILDHKIHLETEKGDIEVIGNIFENPELLK